MYKLKHLVPLFFVPILCAFGNITSQVSDAFKTGNAEVLASFFKEEIDLSILDEEDVYSKADAKNMIKHFFSKHTPSTFKILHEGQSNVGLKYAIGKLTTSDGEFRVSFYVKDLNGKDLIQQIRIDAE